MGSQGSEDSRKGAGCRDESLHQKKFPAGQGAGAELQEQLYRAELEKAEAQARIRVLEKRLGESKGDGSPGSAVSAPPKGDANPGGKVIASAGPAPESIHQDPREIAEKIVISNSERFQVPVHENRRIVPVRSRAQNVYVCTVRSLGS